METRFYCITVLLLILPSICSEKNTTNVLDIRDEHHKAAKYMAVLIFIIFLLYGIVSNTLMATVLCCNRQDNFYSHAFVLIALQLIISNLMAFLPQLIVVIPEILQNKNSSYANQTVWINNTFSTFNTVSIYAVLHFSFLLAVNRFVVFILPKYNVFFESSRLYSLIILVWLSVLAITFTDYYYCTRKFLAWNLSWEGNCAKSNGAGDTWWRLRYLWSIFLPNGMFIIYVVIFCSIRRKHRFAANINQSQKNTNIHAVHGATVTKTHDYEWSMLIQAAWSYGIMEIGIITFNFLPSTLIKIFGERIDIPSRIFVNSYAIAFCAVLPTVYFIYGEGARNIVKQYFNHLLHFKIAPSKNKVIFIGVKTRTVLW